MTGRYKKMKKGKSWVIILVAVICIGLLGWYSTAVITDTKQKQEATANGESTKDKDYQNIKLGLDLSGGVSITYHIKDKNPSDKDVNDTIAKLEERAESYTTEYSVYKSGDDRITVEIPGVDDPNKVLEDLGSPGSLYFIAQYDSDGNANYTQDTSVEGGYKLNYDIDTLKANGSVILDGNDVKDASAQYDQSSSTSTKEPVVSLKLKDKAIDTWADATKKAKDAGQSIGIYYDDHFISVPTVSAVISDGNCVINGMKDYDEATSLATFIRVGAINLQLEELESNVVGAQLGGTALTNAVKAAIIGIILIMIFMIVLYGILGVVASIGLALYSMLTVLFIYWFEITLTLPGIAGIILGIGMGVDANIIVAERIKEELRLGKTLGGAIEQGYKRAWAAVFDSNITVIFVAVILMGSFGSTDSIFGTLLKPIFSFFGASMAGTIYSLGFTLLVGIITNFIFGIFCSRLMLESLARFKCFRKRSFFGVKDEVDATPVLERKRIKIVQHTKVYAIISSVLVITFAALTIAGIPNIAIEFKGGTLLSYSYNGSVDDSNVKKIVKDACGEDCTVTIGEDFSSGKKSLQLSFASKNGISDDEQQSIKDELQKAYPDNEIDTLESTNVSPTNGKTFFAKSLVALLLAVVVMIIYIGIRFRNIGGISAGAFAVLGLLHDMVMVYGSFIIFGFDINSNFIAVLLTIMGYSINSTIIIYDRIRENKRLYGKKLDIQELTNLSVTQTVTRNIHTNVTTVSVMIIVCIVCALRGVTSIMSFALPMIVGIVSGVYTSMFLAPSLWTKWQQHQIKKHPDRQNNNYGKKKKKSGYKDSGYGYGAQV